MNEDCFVMMNFSLPWILIFLYTGSTNNLQFSVRTTTLALIFSLHNTDWQRVLDGGVRDKLHHDVLHVLRPVLLALLPRPDLVPAGHELDAVTIHQSPPGRTFIVRAETGEVPGVGLSRGQP